MANPIIAWDEWRRHWPIMIPCVLGLAMVALHAYAVQVMYGPLEEAFGWTRKEVSSGPLVLSVCTLLLAPWGGRLVKRHGPRRVALLGVPCFSAAIAAISLAGPSIWSWWAVYVLLAVALILIYPSVWTAAVVPRFAKNRGLALAITLSGTGITSAFVPYIGARLLGEFGWRGAYLGLGAMSFVLAMPLVLLLFDREKVSPSQTTAQPGSDQASQPVDVPGELTSPKFIRLGVAGFAYTLATTTIGMNAVPILVDDGFDLVRAAEIAGLMGISTIIGRALGGFLLDHFDGRFIASGAGIGVITAAMVLLGLSGNALAASLALIALGLASGAEYDACAYLCTRHFHPANFATLFGTIGGLFGFGAGMTPFIASAVFDATGSYDAALIGTLPLLAISCLLFFSLGKYPDRI